MFIFLIFGALGAGVFFFIQNLFGIDHILGAVDSSNEYSIWFLAYWATDFFYVGMTVILSYLIAGIPSIAPSLSLGLYFAHFAGEYSTNAASVYYTYNSAPLYAGGGANIGYMGYLIMAVALSLLIKYLFAGWDNAKKGLGKKLDRPVAAVKKKIKLIPNEMNGALLIEQADLLMYILIIPIACAVFTFTLIKYGIQLPFAALGEVLITALTDCFARNIVIGSVVMGLMVGFDIIGPVSLAAFAVAVAAFMQGNAQLLTIYGACFITVGWSPLGLMVFRKIFKRFTFPFDNDDNNLALSGPINAFFENVKLTVAFSMPMAYRSPFTVIPGLMAGSAFTGLLTSAFGIVNTSYLTELPKYGTGMTMRELLFRGEYYLSFTLPLRSGEWFSCRIPLFFIVIAGGFFGGAVMLLLKSLAYRHQCKIGTNVDYNDDIVIELRRIAAEYLHKNKENCS